METKSIGTNGKYFRAVVTPNRNKPKEEDVLYSRHFIEAEISNEFSRVR